jgi:hypothetical protein
MNRVIREKNQRHQTEAALHVVESAFKDAEAALEEADGARQVAEQLYRQADEERKVKVSELHETVRAKNSAEAVLGEEKKKTAQLFDDLDKEHENRLACEILLLHLQSQLAALDAKLDVVVVERDHVTNENTKLHNDIQQLIGRQVMCRSHDNILLGNLFLQQLRTKQNLRHA